VPIFENALESRWISDFSAERNIALEKNLSRTRDQILYFSINPIISYPCFQIISHDISQLFDEGISYVVFAEELETTKEPETIPNYRTIVKRVCHLIVSIFFPQEHVNLVGRDNENGPVLVSVKAETVAGQEHWRVLLRLRAGSTHDLIPTTNLSSNPTPTKMVKVKAMIFISNNNSFQSA